MTRTWKNLTMDTELLQLLETYVDKGGHSRFVERACLYYFSALAVVDAEKLEKQISDGLISQTDLDLSKKHLKWFQEKLQSILSRISEDKSEDEDARAKALRRLVLGEHTS